MSTRPPDAAPVVVVGGGVVGAAVLHALARRGVAGVLLEAGPELGLQASGTNSGILHTGFDSEPGSLETELILASAALRPAVHAEVGVAELRCGAVMRPADPSRAPAVAALADNARRNGVDVTLADDGALHVPGEWVCDPVGYVLALAAAAERAGASVRTGARVTRSESGARRRRRRRDRQPRARCARPRWSTARACAPTRWPAWPGTTTSTSTRARVSSWSSARPSPWGASCCPCRRRAPRACCSSPPSTGT